MSAQPDSKNGEKLPGTVVIADFAERRARDATPDDLTVSDDDLVPGSRLGRYLIVGRLGGGGMGVVYKAQDTELDRTVALKVLPPHLCRHPDYLQRFRAEAQAHARLNDPYIVTLYSLMELPAGAVLVMEYVEGQTLEQRLKVGGPLEPGEAVRIFDQALRAVEHMHLAGVVHRDLKPANIFITRDNNIKLMDFGVAKLMDQPDHGPRGTMVGTLLYIAPEQINGHRTDYRCDVYTLGVSLFETVTGRLPFERRSDYALMHAHVQERPPRPTELQRSLPRALETLILKAIEKEPARRFQSAAEFRAALLQLGVIERRAGGDTGNRKRARHGWWFDLTLAASLAALLYLLGLFPSLLRTAPPESAAVAPVATTPAPPRAQAPRPNPVVPPARKPAKPAGEDYNALRDAWGR